VELRIRDAEIVADKKIDDSDFSPKRVCCEKNSYIAAGHVLLRLQTSGPSGLPASIAANRRAVEGAAEDRGLLKICRAIREEAEERCWGRRLAVMEGGYRPDLRWCVKSFVEGFG
jgi:hypothetical protein